MQSKIKRGKHTNFAINKKGLEHCVLENNHFARKSQLHKLSQLPKKWCLPKMAHSHKILSLNNIKTDE